MVNRPVIEVRWDWLAPYDRKIRRKARQPSLEALFPPRRRFTIRLWHAYLGEWTTYGPCQVWRLSKTHLHYWHEGYDRPPTGRRDTRRMPRTDVRIAVSNKRVTFH